MSGDDATHCDDTNIAIEVHTYCMYYQHRGTRVRAYVAAGSWWGARAGAPQPLSLASPLISPARACGPLIQSP